MTPWLTDDLRAMFGTAPDREIAALAGVSVHSVRMARVAHGLPARPRGPVPKGRVVVEISLRPETVAAIDAARGDMARGEWIERVVNAGLSVVG